MCPVTLAQYAQTHLYGITPTYILHIVYEHCETLVDCTPTAQHAIAHYFCLNDIINWVKMAALVSMFCTTLKLFSFFYT